MARKDPMCMDTARWMFDCCRIPGLEGADWSISTNKETDTGSEGHIIVIRRGRFWKIDITTYEGGKRRLLSTAEIQRQLQAVYDSTDKDYPAIGTLTTQDRDAWAKDYAALVKDPHNASILEDIISSAFVVCLDTNKPTNVVETSVSLFHGGKQGESLRDRWYDKPCQFVIYDNGEAGFIGEHSVMDGTPTVTMCDVVLTDLHDKNFDHGAPYPTPASSSHSTLAAPKALDWASTPAIEGSIATAQKSALDLVRHQDLGMLSTSYGRDTIKKFGFSPDGWTQMLVQLAYTRLLNFLGAKREGGTYEAATTRKFYKGRTETIRIVTNESMKWCNAMDDSSIGEEEKRNLLRIATDRHRNDALDAGNAMGVDRHLFGMKHMLKPGDQIPEIYSDPLYQRASTWVLSTSAIFSPHFTRGYGWGQVVPNGFGVAYMTGFPDCLKFTITSRTTQPNAKFIEELQRASDDMYELFVKVEKPKQSKL
ncbi:Carnitine O-acetyltransferase mitochondrial [Tulasnella sp. 418]|nr:Carnitine O-acetyltransferase mitochondrial [Tulasnella sp. 418]